MINFFDNKERVGAFLLLVFSLFYLRSSLHIAVDSFDLQIGFTSKTLPVFLATCGILVSTSLLVLSCLRSQKESILDIVRHFDWKPTLGLILLMAIYVSVFSYLGFVVASVLFLLTAFFLLGERRLLVSLSIALAVVLFLWLILTQIFGLYLDSGSLYQDLRS